MGTLSAKLSWRKSGDPAKLALARRLGLLCLLLPALVYLSELLHLLEEPLFSRVYYGNLNAVFFHVLAALYLFAMIALFHRLLLRPLGLSPFRRHAAPLPLGRKLLLYCLSVAIVLSVGIWLDFRFKIVLELGERITGMTLLGNLCGYLHIAAQLFCAVYFIFLVESCLDALFVRRPALPFGGLAAMLCFGLLQLYFDPSRFSLLYLLLFFYDGLVYRLSGRRFGVSYGLAVILYIL